MAAPAGGAISKRRKFVADGVFYAELNEFFQRELAEEGYSGVEVRVTPTVTDISELKQLQFAYILVNTNNCWLQSFVPPTPKKSLASKVVAFGNSHLSSKNDSNFQRIQCLSTLLRSRTVVYLLLLNANLCDTSSSMDWLSGERAMVSSGSSWRVEPKVARWLYLESSVPLALRA